jgi:hypothetical protein
MLALFGTSLPVVQVAPASTGNITPVVDFISNVAKVAFPYTITHLSSTSPRRQRETSPPLPRPILCPQSSTDSGSSSPLWPHRSYHQSTSSACIPSQDKRS